jgi:hypothetical protein
MSTKTRESIDLKSQDIEFGILKSQDVDYFLREQERLIQSIQQEMQKMGVVDHELISEILNSGQNGVSESYTDFAIGQGDGSLDEDPVFNQDLKALQATIESLGG